MTTESITAPVRVTYYMVGGHVRDGLLGLKSKDVDFAVEAESYDAMLTALEERGVYVWQHRPEFVSVRANDPEYGPADFTLCRKDGSYSDGRRPDSVRPATILDDLARRDFTVNAIAKTLDGTIIDPHRGRADLEAMLLRCVGRAEDRFREDSLRLLRAVRFHVVRGFRLDVDVEACLQDPAVLAGLGAVSVERVYDELDKCFAASTHKTLLFMRKHEALEMVLFTDVGVRLRPSARAR